MKIARSQSLVAQPWNVGNGLLVTCSSFTGITIDPKTWLKRELLLLPWEIARYFIQNASTGIERRYISFTSAEILNYPEL